MTINQVCHVIFEKKPDAESVAFAAASDPIGLTEENCGKSSGLISDKVFTKLLVAVLIIIKKYIKIYYYKFKTILYIVIYSLEIAPIFQDSSICCPKTLKINEKANPDLERFIIIFIIVYPPI